MTIADYYRILDLTPGASALEIKQAYRQKARLYHPDISKTPNSQELFILATEAYDFLISCNDKLYTDQNPNSQVINDWQKRSQERTRRKAYVYSRGSYSAFKNSNLYKTTRIFEGMPIVLGFVISIMIIAFTIIGYFYRLKHPIPEMEKPSLLVFIMLLILGIVFFLVALASLTNHIKRSAKRNRKSNVA